MDGVPVHPFFWYDNDSGYKGPFHVTQPNFIFVVEDSNDEDEGNGKHESNTPLQTGATSQTSKTPTAPGEDFTDKEQPQKVRCLVYLSLSYSPSRRWILGIKRGIKEFQYQING